MRFYSDARMPEVITPPVDCPFLFRRLCGVDQKYRAWLETGSFPECMSLEIG